MNNYRELLELAAISINTKIKWLGEIPMIHGIYWNPLAKPFHANALAEYHNIDIFKLTLKYKCKTAEDTRRAIVIVAAEIGENKNDKIC